MCCSIGGRTSRPFGSDLDSFDCNATSSSERVATRASGVPSVERRLRHFVFGAGAYTLVYFYPENMRPHAITVFWSLQNSGYRAFLMLNRSVAMDSSVVSSR